MFRQRIARTEIHSAGRIWLILEDDSASLRSWIDMVLPPNIGLVDKLIVWSIDGDQSRMYQAHSMERMSAAGSYWNVSESAGRITALIVLIAFIWLMLQSPALLKLPGDITVLSVFWKVIVPLVPVSLLIAPSVWRNICPLAFLNSLGNKLRKQFSGNTVSAPDDRFHASQGGTRVWLVKHGLKVAVLLLFILVPARLLLFNNNALVLAVLLIALAILTCIAGAALPFKSAWCSSICPVYPVEKAYGMKPFFLRMNTLCKVAQSDQAPGLICGGCTRNCLDLKLVPAAKRGSEYFCDWRPESTLRFFISVFPGFVLAYHMCDQFVHIDSLSAWAAGTIVYGCFLTTMFASWLVYKLAQFALISDMPDNMRSSWRLDLTFVAFAFNFYYWMAMPGVVSIAGPVGGIPEALHSHLSIFLFACTFLLSLFWLRRAW